MTTQASALQASAVPALLVALTLFAVCAFLRVGLADRHGLWADEFFSLAMATGHSLEHPAEAADPALGDYVELPFAVAPSAYARYLRHDHPAAGLVRVSRATLLSDTNPPLYYLLLNLWMRALDASDAALRSFSVAWSLACFPVLWSLARKIGGRAASLPTCLLFTLSPVCLFYSTEGRQYAMLLFLTITAMWLALDLRQRGASAARLSLWVATAVAGLLTHYFFLFVWSPAVFWLLLHPGKASRRQVLASALATFVLILPWYALLPRSASAWRVTSYWLTMHPSGYDPMTTPLFLPWSFLSVAGVWGDPAPWDDVNPIGLVALAVFALWRFRAGLLSPPWQLLWLWLIAPCLGLVVIDLLRGTYLTAVPRYALAGMPAAFVLVGVTIGRLVPTLRAMALALVIVINVAGVGLVYGMQARSFQDYRQVGKLLADETGPSDVIIIHSIPSGVTGIARYIEQSRQGGSGAGFASWVGQLGQRRVPDDLKALAAGRERIVLVDSHAVGNPLPERDWLVEHATLEGEKKIHDTRIQYFTPRDGGLFFPN